MSARLACVVPFCKRTRGDRKGDPVDRYNEWICGDHWRLVDRRTRRLLRKAIRHMEGEQSPRSWRVMNWLWERCKRQAIERAAGIA